MFRFPSNFSTWWQPWKSSIDTKILICKESKYHSLVLLDSQLIYNVSIVLGTSYNQKRAESSSIWPSLTFECLSGPVVWIFHAKFIKSFLVVPMILFLHASVVRRKLFAFQIDFYAMLFATFSIDLITNYISSNVYVNRNPA